jgi:ParB-like chromosome segregation protein Spo0J
MTVDPGLTVAMAKRIELWPLDRLKPYDRNARTHSAEQVAQIAASIVEFGFTNPILVDSNDGIIAGHGRLSAAQELGLRTVPVVVLDHLSERQRKAYILADNQLALNAGWDTDLLRGELKDLAELDFDLSLIGFSDDELADLLPDIEELPPEDADADAVPELPADPISKPGDVWLLGKHRVMCGDSTDVLAVEKLTAGSKVDMLYCDPPYGMALDTDYSKIKGSAKSPNAKGYKWEKVIGDDVDFDPAPLIELFAETKEQFWWGADYFFECLPRGGSLLVWQKRDKADAEMIGNDFEICWSKQRHKKATFWKRWVGFDSVERGEKRVHPTQKPIDLHCWVFDQWGKASDTVLDLFGGSGSTLIACEKTGRQARLMELDPRYCDVIVKRWQQFTGKTATLEATGEPFPDDAG